MRFFTRHAGEADGEFWSLLKLGLKALLDRVQHADYVRDVPAQDKVLNTLILRDDRTRAAAFLAAGGLQLTEVPTRPVPGGIAVELPYWGDPAASVPAEYFLLADRQLSLNSSITDVAWEGATLRLDGWAHIRNIDLAVTPPDLSIAAIEQEGRRVPLRVHPRSCQDPNEASKHRHCDYANGCFTAWLDSSSLPANSNAWHLEIELTAARVTRRGVLEASRSLDRLPDPDVGRARLSFASVGGTRTIRVESTSAGLFTDQTEATDHEAP
jgi:hypothetical protein